MDERERDEILWRLDERTKRVDDHLNRLDKRMEDVEESVEQHDDRINDNENSIDTIMKAGGGAIGLVTTSLSALIAHVVGFIKI